MRVVDPYSLKIYGIKAEHYSQMSSALRLMRRECVLAPNGVYQADLGSLFNARLVKALSARG